MRSLCILWVSILSCLAMSLHGEVSVSPAEDALVKKLKMSNLKVGYDKDKERLVFVGVTVKEMKDPANDSAFQIKRARMFRVAEVKARHALMDYVEKDVTAGERVRAYLGEGRSEVEFISRFSVVSSMKLMACTAVASVESYVEGVYSVAVAVGWSDRAERSVREALARNGYGSTRKEEVEKWLEGYDYASVIGSRQFVDSTGVVYQVGIAAADVDGLTGMKLGLARRKAEMSARRELAFALCVPMLGTRDLFETAVRGSSGGGDFDTHELELSTKIEARIKGLLLPGVSRMHEATVRHPVTGREMYVAVCGLTLSDQLIGTKTTGD